MSDKLNNLYGSYKEQNSSRQKYYLAIVAVIVGFIGGYLVGTF